MNTIVILQKPAIGLIALTSSLFMTALPVVAEDAPPAPEASLDVYKILTENDQMRVIEATWKPGQRDNFCSHPGDRASIYLMHCKLRLFNPEGTHRDGFPKAGKSGVRTNEPVKSHFAQNIGDELCKVVLVEIKQ